MARFQAVAEGSGSQATRLGHAETGASAQANGWSIGGRADVCAAGLERTPGGKVRDAGRDVVSLAVTGGSGNRSALLALGDWQRDELGAIMPRDAVAHIIAKALAANARRVARLAVAR